MRNYYEYKYFKYKNKYSLINDTKEGNSKVTQPELKGGLNLAHLYYYFKQQKKDRAF